MIFYKTKTIKCIYDLLWHRQTTSFCKQNNALALPVMYY